MIIDFSERKRKYQEPTKDNTSAYMKQKEAIGVQWAVINNLRAYNGDEARNLELLCLQSIQLHQHMAHSQAHNAPCYVRLCMLYEKQKRYEDAIEICKKAIDNGAYEDGSSGKMFGRLARMIRKAAEQISDEEVTTHP